MKPWILGLALVALGASCNTADLMLSIKGSVADAGTPLPLPAIVPAGGTFFQSSDISGINVGSASSGYQLFYTTDGTDPAFTPGGKPDYTHTGRSDNGFMGWGTNGPWAVGIGSFSIKAQNLDKAGRTSKLASAQFRVVGHLGAVSAVGESGAATAVAISAADDVATATSGSVATITVRNPNNQVLWTRTISGTGTVNVKSMAFSTSGDLWLCGNVQSGGTFTFNGSPVWFVPGSSIEAGFLATYDSAGTCLGVVYEASSDLNSSMDALTIYEGGFYVFVAGNVYRTASGTFASYQRKDSAGAALGLSPGALPINTTEWNATGLRFGPNRDYQATLRNQLNVAGCSDGFTSVSYESSSNTLAFGGWVDGTSFSYDGSTPVSGIAIGYRAPLVVSSNAAMGYQSATTANRTASGGVTGQVDAVATLPGGMVVAAGSEAPNDGGLWSWPGGSTTTPTDTSSAFWVGVAASTGQVTLAAQTSSPTSVTVTGLVYSSSHVFASFTLGAGTSTGSLFNGQGLATGSSPWVEMLDTSLASMGWWRDGGLGPGTAGPLVHAAGALNRVATLWYPSGAPAMDLGQGLTAPSTSGALLIRLFD